MSTGRKSGGSDKWIRPLLTVTLILSIVSCATFIKRDKTDGILPEVTIQRIEGKNYFCHTEDDYSVLLKEALRE